MTNDGMRAPRRDYERTGSVYRASKVMGGHGLGTFLNRTLSPLERVSCPGLYNHYAAAAKSLPLQAVYRN